MGHQGGGVAIGVNQSCACAHIHTFIVQSTSSNDLLRFFPTENIGCKLGTVDSNVQNCATTEFLQSMEKVEHESNFGAISPQNLANRFAVLRTFLLDTVNFSNWDAKGHKDLLDVSDCSAFNLLAQSLVHWEETAPDCLRIVYNVCILMT